MKTSGILSSLIVFSFIGLSAPQFFKDAATNMQPGFKSQFSYPKPIFDSDEKNLDNKTLLKKTIPRYLWRTFENSVSRTSQNGRV